MKPILLHLCALQRILRGAAVRCKVARLRSAAVAMQSAWRRRQAMRRYAQAVRNVTAVQVIRTSAPVHKWCMESLSVYEGAPLGRAPRPPLACQECSSGLQA